MATRYFSSQIDQREKKKVFCTSSSLGSRIVASNVVALSIVNDIVEDAMNM
jgi:hypothetical protein